MTPPLPWYLSLVSGKIRLYKNGQLMLQDKGPDAGKEYGCVTSVEVAVIRDKELLRFKFTLGKPRGFSLASFTFTGSAFSRFFHVKGVKTPSDFVETWEKFVQPSLDSTTGAMSSWTSADDSANQTETPPQSTATSHSFSDKTPRSTRKRPLPESSKTPSIRPSKVLKESGSSTSGARAEDNDVNLDEAISKCFIGYYTLPVSCLIEPQPARLLRPVDELFIESLKLAMKGNPSTDAAPIVGLVVLGQDETFDELKKEMYQYETLGGNNSRVALQALSSEDDSHPAFRTRLVSVYSGLSDDEAIRLAAKHNKTTSFFHEMSTWDKVNICRSALYSMTRSPYGGPTPKSKPQGWKTHCSALLMSEVRKLDDACIFFLASLPKDVFETLRRVFDLYSKGDIKGQQVRKGALGMKLDLKGSNFKPLRGLDAEVAHDLLKDVADKEMSMQEMMAECRDVKVLKDIQTKFIKETGVSSWEEATEKFPDFVTADALDEFRGCNFKSGSTPARFKDFCQLAMRTTTSSPNTLFEQGRFTLGNATAIVTHGTTINHASASELCRSNGLDLTGAAFSMIHGTGLEEEAISTLKMYVRSIKAINTTVGKTSYAIAVSGSPYAISDIKAALIECGMTDVEVAFVHLKDSTNASLGHALLDATKAIVIAQCGQALSHLPRRTNMFSSTAAILQDDAGDRLGVGENFDKEVYRELIELYTSPADLIISVQLSTGQPPMGALLSKRNSINYAQEANTLQLIKRDMNIFCAQETSSTT